MFTISTAKILAFSPDGGRLAYMNSFSRSVRIMESATGKEHQVVKSSMPLLSVAFSADGARVRAAGFLKWEQADGYTISSGSGVREWAVQPLKERAPQGAKKVTEVTVWSPDGSRRAVRGLSFNKGEGIRILDRAGKLIHVFSEHTAPLPGPAVFFSPDGRLVCSRDSKGDTKIWEADSGKVRWETNLKTLFPDATTAFSTYGIVFSPDGRFMSVPSPAGIKVVSTADFSEKHTVAGTDPAHFRGPECAFSPDGRRLVIVDCPFKRVGYGGNKQPALEKLPLKVWDVDAGREIESTTYDHPEGFPSRAPVTFSSNSRYFALSLPGRGAVTIYDAATGKERTVVKIALGNAADRPTVVLSPDGERVLLAKQDRAFQPGGTGPTVWETATGKLLYRIEAHPGAPILHIVFSPDGKRIATGNPSSIKLWDAATGRELLSLKGAFGLGTLSFSEGGHRLLLRTRDGEGLSWDATPRAAAAQPH
jgi:WD40 repeat protein